MDKLQQCWIFSIQQKMKFHCDFPTNFPSSTQNDRFKLFQMSCDDNLSTMCPHSQCSTTERDSYPANPRLWATNWITLFKVLPTNVCRKWNEAKKSSSYFHFALFSFSSFFSSSAYFDFSIVLFSLPPSYPADHRSLKGLSLSTSHSHRPHFILKEF